jgi:hypothetical protein
MNVLGRFGYHYVQLKKKHDSEYPVLSGGGLFLQAILPHSLCQHSLFK